MAFLRETENASRPDTAPQFARLLTENLMVGLLVLTVVVMSDQVREPWHSLSNIAVAVALVGYAIRLSLSQHRQQNELRVRQGAEINLVAARDQLDSSFQEAQQWAIELNQLSELGQLVQSCLTEHEAYLLIGTALNKFLPECSGALYTMTPGGQRVEVISQWGSHPPMEKVFDPAECWGVRRGRAHHWNRGTTPVRCAHLALAEKDLALCVPLITQGEMSGILVLLQDCNATPEQTDPCRSTWSRIQRVGTAVGEQTALTLANLRLRSALREQAIRDPLTSLFNRRYLEETLERELQHAIRRNRPISLMMLDLDHFKRFNDEFGHDVGDLVLRSIGEFLRAHTRAEDIVCRYGGEEFLIVMLEATIDVAHSRAEQIREGLKQLRIANRGRDLGTATTSIGLACTSQGLLDAATLIQAADAALYRAKREGRDRVSVSQYVTMAAEAQLRKSVRIARNTGQKVRPQRSHSRAKKLSSAADASLATPSAHS